MKICILSEYAYHFLADEEKSKYAGGAEMQMATLAKEFVKRKHVVSFITFENLRKVSEKNNGIMIYNPFDNQGKGYTYLFPQNVYKLFKILNKIDADVYIQRATTPLTGILALYTKLRKKIFLYSVSSDEEVSVNMFINGLKDLKKLVFQFGVKNCDCVICQTNKQKNLLKQTINKEGIIIKNIYLLPKIKNGNNNSQLKVLWVGRITKEKRPELFLTLAKKFPNFKFCMIASKHGPSKTSTKYYNKIKKEASKINNLDFHGYVPYNEINKYYLESALLINTSIVEGFPNTFLEAWGNYIPVITLDFDPDEIICEHKLGLHSKTFEQMIDDIKIMLINEKLRKEMGINSRRYVEKEHDVKKIINDYEYLIKSLITGGS
jgi:glycosyltransferase involved in cell wall biosynthesis